MLKIDADEHEGLDRSLMEILEAWTGHKIRDAHRALIWSIYLCLRPPDDY